MKHIKDMSEDELKQYKHLKAQIRKGKLPRYMFIKGEDGTSLERKTTGYRNILTWKRVSTISFLMS